MIECRRNNPYFTISDGMMVLFHQVKFIITIIYCAPYFVGLIFFANSCFLKFRLLRKCALLNNDVTHTIFE